VSGVLNGRVAVITGATGGLGRVVAEAFAREGASLALLSSNQGKLDELAAGLNISADRVSTHAADLRKADSAQKAADAIAKRYGKIEVLAHLVGGWAGGKPIVETSAEELDSMLEQHVLSTFRVAQAFVPHLTKAGWGRVIAVSSPLAQENPSGMSAYGAAKAAEEALLFTLANEVGAKGITTNVIQVRTIDVEHARLKTPSKQNGNWTTPEEIAEAMLYLCSPAGAVVNGQRLKLTD
jgi:NAD(P)-dependent dehydrogenase (short-subunit alcohol dehydrogenase family)